MSEKLKFVLEFCDSALIRTLLATGNSQIDWLPEEEKLTVDYGKDIAIQVKERCRLFGDCCLLAKQLGVREIYYFKREIGSYGSFAEYNPGQKTIGLNHTAIDELLPVLNRYYSIKKSFLTDLLITHELFHHLEEHHFTKTDQYVARRLLTPKRRLLREIAAYSFTEEMLSFPAQVIDLIYFCVKYGTDNIYQETCRLLGLKPTIRTGN